MSSVVPNLFDREDDARRLYSLYLIRLQIRDDYDRVIDACGQIRKHAAATVGVKSALSYCQKLCSRGEEEGGVSCC